MRWLQYSPCSVRMPTVNLSSQVRIFHPFRRWNLVLSFQEYDATWCLYITRDNRQCRRSTYHIQKQFSISFHVSCYLPVSCFFWDVFAAPVSLRVYTLFTKIFCAGINCMIVHSAVSIEHLPRPMTDRRTRGLYRRTDRQTPERHSI